MIGTDESRLLLLWVLDRRAPLTARDARSRIGTESRLMDINAYPSLVHDEVAGRWGITCVPNEGKAHIRGVFVWWFTDKDAAYMAWDLECVP